MERIVKCVSTTKNPNGTGTVVLHELDKSNKVVTVIQVSFDKAEKVDSFVHLADMAFTLSYTK